MAKLSEITVHLTFFKINNNQSTNYYLTKMNSDISRGINLKFFAGIKQKI